MHHYMVKNDDTYLMVLDCVIDFLVTGGWVPKNWINRQFLSYKNLSCACFWGYFYLWIVTF